MIVDYIKNIEFYKFIKPEFLEAIDFALSLKEKPVGKYTKDDIFAIVQQGTTGSVYENKFESHLKYIDVQIIIEGEELLEWQNIEKLKKTSKYDEDNDIVFYDGAGDSVLIKKDMFYIMNTDDGHKPCCHKNIETIYKKIVLKLPVN